MKKLQLQEILAQIKDHLVHAPPEANPLIEHVMDYAEKDIEDHTLVFHMYEERIRGKYWKNNKAIVIVTDKPELCTDLGEEIILLETNNLEAAYWSFIEYYRGLFDIPVIGVTGTCGKTTTKEMIKQILREDFVVKATWMSMNSMSVNLRYLTGIDETTEVAVFEMPVAYPGYLKTACRCFKPQIRILLNIGVHHLADCETPEVYMKAKGEIVEGLDPVSDILILNADDENINKVIDASRFHRVVFFGKSTHSHYRIERVQYAKGGMEFTFNHNRKCYDAFVPGLGEHNVYNALAAIIAASSVGVDMETAIKRLASFQHVKEHLEFKKGANGCTVIDDSWNSSPLSMAAGLEVLKNISNGKTAIALLGYMPQLGKGKHALEQYREMGKAAAQSNVDLLVIVDDKARAIGEAALELGMPPEKVHFCETGEEVYQVIKSYLKPDTNIYLKVTYRVMKQPGFQELRKKLIPDDGK
jgi:UDP-N-acetylmuramoyl-tripeptide--D-alanyl-D-alanine ligase